MAPKLQYVNGFPYWSQLDFGGQIEMTGCGPTSGAMVLCALGKDTNPQKTCTESNGHGYTLSGGAQGGPGLFQFLAKKYGVAYGTVGSISDLEEKVRQGYPVIIHGQKNGSWSSWNERCLSTCYSPAGHYVVVVGMKGNDFVVNDPRGIKYSGIRPRSHVTDGYGGGFTLGKQKFQLDPDKFKEIDTLAGVEDSGATSQDNSGGGGSVKLSLTFNNTTTVQESLPNANTSDNWVDMHEIKGVTLHMYPPYHNCTADSMEKTWKNLNWKTNFHYKVDKDTKIDFSKKPISGQTTGGNVVGSSVSDYEVTPKDPLYSSVIIPIGGGGTGEATETFNAGDTGMGTTTPEKIYNYCKAQGCSDEASAGIIANCECETHFNAEDVNSSGHYGLFQMADDRFAALEKKAKAAGKTWKDVDIQIQHMWEQLCGQDALTLKLLKGIYGGDGVSGFKKESSAYKAGYNFGKAFERGGGNEARGKRAEKWLELIKQNKFNVCADGDSLPENAKFSSGGSGTGFNGQIFGWPVPDRHKITAPYNQPRGGRLHKGIDIGTQRATNIPCYSYAGGTVKTVGFQAQRGYYVIVDHGSGVKTLYQHLKKGSTAVKQGETISSGQKIGIIGKTGVSYGEHLHFEFFINGVNVDPTKYVSSKGGPTSANPFNRASASSIMATKATLRAQGLDNSNEPFGWPIPQQTFVQSYYGYRNDTRGYAFHSGIDIVAYKGSGVYCYADGTVTSVLKGTSLKGYVKIDHGNGVETIYGALNEDNINVEKGDKVVGGQCIGLSDCSYINSLAHVHFELWINGERVDPLDYIEPGGGNKKIPENFGEDYVKPQSLMTAKDITAANDPSNITWDKVNKGRIVFASYQNNQHTYIDANMFNNQHPKYTLSVGAFFYDESDLVEKSKNVSWPKTEKKLIEQCAKVLYDEGKTSKSLWREFDLNRAPSPFLYLDTDKWKAFCKEVDKLVSWANKKYGKVTSTYVPNNLLTDQNNNKFVETAPDGGTQNSTDAGGSVSGVTGITNFENGLYIGDSWIDAIEDYIKNDKSYCHGYEGKTAVYFYNKEKGVDRIEGMPDDASFVFIYLGLNDCTWVAKSKTRAFLKKVKSKYSNVPIFVGEVMKVVNKGEGKTINSKLDNYNSYLKSYCDELGINVVNVSSGLLDSNGYLKESLATKDHYHLISPKKFYENIKQALGNSNVIMDSGSTGESSESSGGTSSSGDIQAKKANVGKYGYVKIYDSCKLYKGPDTATKKLQTLQYGDEVHILGANGIFYQVSCKGNGGYVRAKNIELVEGDNKYGYTYKANIGKMVKILPNTAMYHLPNISMGKYRTLSAAKTGTIIHSAVNFYEVKVDGKTGWVKAYRCTPVVSNGSPRSLALDNPVSIKAKEDENPEKPISSSITATKDNLNKYCYYGNTTSGILKAKASSKGKKVCGLSVGDEMKITGTDGYYYKVTFKKKEGYVPAKDVCIIGKTHGSVKQSALKQNCWIKWDGVSMYTDEKLTEKCKVNLEEGDNAVVYDVNKDKGLYKIITAKKTGWVKGYCVTFNYNEFQVEKDNTSNESLTYAGDEEEEKNDTVIDINGGDFDDSSLTGWKKEGSLNFLYKQNPDWGTTGHWAYRGKGFARIRNINNKLAGIKHKIDIPGSKKTYNLRVLFWVKQVTRDDEPDGPSNPNTLKGNGLHVKTLNKNSKVKHSKFINLTGLTNTTWSRVGCLFSDIKENEVEQILICNEKKYDLYIDDLTIEMIAKKDIDKSTDDANTSSGITLTGVGVTSLDNGGIMMYSVAEPEDKNAAKPDIETIISQTEYEEIMKNASPALIDLYTNSFEPYDKGLDIAKTVGTTVDMRLQTLTEKLRTFTNNIIQYKVTETGPGSTDHCVKPVDELNVLFKNTDCPVEPIYPDLVIPPKYSTTTYDKVTKNSLPLQAVQEGTMNLGQALNNSFSYDYSLLDKKKKESAGKPINYLDPYPYDDKINDLEEHKPKVLIDEIESRLYTDNHPGSPIAHPIAKNFAMLNDMAIHQSKVTEQRLVRIENILSTIIRNMGRLGSRMNVNCVYYGGQDVFGKYKTIRCLHDDRIHDGCSVTIDQCMCCTRYEPIIGQIYDILDETGFNGSAILDDMQMSYMKLDDFKNLNDVSKRTSKWDYINSNNEEKTKPKNLIEVWQKEDKDKHIESLKKKYTDKTELNKALNEINEEDYAFKMDWTEDDVDLHTPDIKPYPTEKIAAKYKQQYGDKPEKDAPAEQKTSLDISEKVINNLSKSVWVDTRKKDDTVQINKYTSLDFYFENFNLNRTGYEYDNGLKGNVGLHVDGINISGSSLNGNECRKKITETALAIVEQHKNKQACYSNTNRTIDFDKPVHISGTYLGMKNPIGYDCTSFVSCCYKAAGLKSFYNGHTGQGSVADNSLVQEIKKKGGKVWYCDEAGMQEALPGDVIMYYKYGQIDRAKLTDFSGCKATHAMIYMGNGMVAHASLPEPSPNGILYEKLDLTKTSGAGARGKHCFFLRPQELIDADKAANQTQGGSGLNEVKGTIDGIDYVCELKGSKCTQYKAGEGGPLDALDHRLNTEAANTCASHNIPYGSKIYFPKLKGKSKNNPSAIFTVNDTGNAGFDFDICCPPSVYYGNGRLDAYVVSWGSGKGVACSHTRAHDLAGVDDRIMRDYVRNGGTTYLLTKFCDDDKNITTKSWWRKYM